MQGMVMKMNIRDKEICRIVRRSISENIYHGSDDNSPELCHFGIKGMKWGVRRFQKKDGSYTPAGKKRYTEKPKSQLEQDVDTRLDKEKLSKAGYEIKTYGEYSCYAEKDINGIPVSIRLDKYDDKTKGYRLVDDPEGVIETAENFMKDKAGTAELISKAKDRAYDDVIDYAAEKVSREKFRSGLELYGFTLDPENATGEISHFDPTISYHSLDAEIDMNTREIMYMTMNG